MSHIWVNVWNFNLGYYVIECIVYFLWMNLFLILKLQESCKNWQRSVWEKGIITETGVCYIVDAIKRIFKEEFKEYTHITGTGQKGLYIINKYMYIFPVTSIKHEFCP